MQSNKQETIEKIYVDSNIWFSYITKGKYDNSYSKAKKLIEEIISNRNKQAVISQLVFLEMLNIFRNKVVQREKYQGKLTSNAMIEKYLKNVVESFSTKFADVITEWESSSKLWIVPVTIPMVEFFKTVQEIQHMATGEIEDVFKCGICKRPRDSYRYRGVDHYDIQHALIAKTGKVNQLATFDRGYEILQKHGFLGSVVLKLL